MALAEARRLRAALKLPTAGALIDGATNAWDLLPVVGGGVADLTRQPSVVIDEGPQRTVHRFRTRGGARRRHAPVLLVPPLAAPATCFDLRRGCSLADGRIVLSDKTIDLRDVRLPVLSVAGEADVLAPEPAVHHVGTLLENSPLVRLESAPGGHLGVLTGMSARRTTWVYLDDWLGLHDEPG